MRFGFIGSLLSGLGSLFGFGSKRELGPAGGDVKRPYIAPQDIRPKLFRRYGRRGPTAPACPACYHNTAKEGLCGNRMCFRFNAATAHTHPDLLSLDREIRLFAQNRWARGGMAALFAR